MELNHLLVVGAGTMGAGIAQWFAQQQVNVTLVDVNQDQLTKAHEQIKKSWDKLQQKGKFTTDQVSTYNSHLVAQTNYPNDCDLVIEAIIENTEIKKSVFKELDQKLPSHTLFASNTSSIPMGVLAKELSEERREKFLGIHFFNPAPIMKLVEVIRSPWVKEETLKHLCQWFESRGKETALCLDMPGFIVNRVARNFYGESLKLLGALESSRVQEIDSILKECGGFRMGPFELMDLIGIDVNYSVSDSVWRSYGHDERFRPHLTQKTLVDSGKLGRKSGEGFYEYK